MAKHRYKSKWDPRVANVMYGVGIWKSIILVKTRFKRFLSFKVGSSKVIHFLDDPWCGTSPLKEVFPHIFVIASDAQSLVVGNFEDGVWCPRLCRNLNDWEHEKWVDLLGRLEEFRILASVRDRLSWSLSSNGQFLTTSLYGSLVKEGVVCILSWTQGVPSKVNFFIWMVTLDKFLF